MCQRTHLLPRLSALNRSQLEHFMTYFLENFDVSCIGSVCLGHKNGMPFVVSSDNKLPNPRCLADFVEC